MRATEPQLYINTVQIRWIENENSLCAFKLHCGLHAYPTIFISTIYKHYLYSLRLDRKFHLLWQQTSPKFNENPVTIFFDQKAAIIRLSAICHKTAI